MMDVLWFDKQSRGSVNQVMVFSYMDVPRALADFIGSRLLLLFTNLGESEDSLRHCLTDVFMESRGHKSGHVPFINLQQPDLHRYCN